MSVHYDAQHGIFYLHSKECTYAFGINALGVPEHLYFGHRIGEDLYCGTYSQNGKCHPVRCQDRSGQLYDLSVLPQELHTPYGGDFYEPSLVLHYPNGSRRSDLRYQGYEIFSEKPSLTGLPGIRQGQTLAVYLEDKDIRVTLLYTVSEHACAIVRSMQVENLGDTPVRLDRAYSFAFSLPNTPWEAVYLAGSVAAETHLHKTTLDRGTFTLDSKRGMSSAACNPMLAVGAPFTGEHTGPAYGINLIYSGSWAIRAERIPTGLLRLTGGINDFDFSWLLQPGETFQTPEAVLVYSSEGYSGLSRQFHNLYRQSLIPARFVNKPRPMVINNWEGTNFLFTGEKLRQIIDRMAGTGVDTFVLDDGWFGKRDSDASGLGDWFVNEEKLGSSLEALIDYTHKKGMRFGLWIEPEMVSRDSDLFRAHPDWVIRTPDEQPLEGRNQLVLDLSREEVRICIAERINRVIREHKIDYIKWDCNRDVSEGYSLALPPERQQELMHRQTLGVYDLFHRIVEANPDVLFEGCASGGSRYDPGMLYYFPQVWISDQTDAPARAAIQYGASVCYPLSSMSCHVTTSPNRRAKHLTPFHARGDIAHLGAAGYEFDTAHLTEEDLNQIAGQVAAYRQDEALVLQGDLYRLSPPSADTNLFAVCVVSKDKKTAKITAMKLQERFNEPTRRLFPEGLQPELLYEVPELGKTMSGSSWMGFGIDPAFPAGDYETLVYHFIAK